MQYIDTGQGEPLMFIHGFLLGPDAYMRSIDELSQAGYRVIAPFLPGYGSSFLSSDVSVSLESLASSCMFVLDECDVTNVPVVGYSLGAAVALKFAHDYPEKVQQLVLLSPLGGSKWEDIDGQPVAIKQRPPIDWAKAYLWHPSTSRDLGAAAFLAARYGIRQVLTRPRAVWSTATLAMKIDLNEELVTLRQRGIPIAVVVASNDVVIPAVHSKSLVDALGCRVTTVEGSHQWALARPKTVSSTVIDALRRT